MWLVVWRQDFPFSSERSFCFAPGDMGIECQSNSLRPVELLVWSKFVCVCVCRVMKVFFPGTHTSVFCCLYLTDILLTVFAKIACKLGPVFCFSPLERSIFCHRKCGSCKLIFLLLLGVLLMLTQLAEYALCLCVCYSWMYVFK